MATEVGRLLPTLAQRVMAQEFADANGLETHALRQAAKARATDKFRRTVCTPDQYDSIVASEVRVAARQAAQYDKRRSAVVTTGATLA